MPGCRVRDAAAFAVAHRPQGGTIHVVVHNQVGFRTPPSKGRLGTYATDVTTCMQLSVFHFNGDDPSMTQPLMCNLIEATRSVRLLYADRLVGRGDDVRVRLLGRAP